MMSKLDQHNERIISHLRLEMLKGADVESILYSPYFSTYGRKMIIDKNDIPSILDKVIYTATDYNDEQYLVSIPGGIYPDEVLEEICEEVEHRKHPIELLIEKKGLTK
ncbi:TPA: hypothetical protein ACXNPR_000412 [Enterobacter cancerogenus]